MSVFKEYIKKAEKYVDKAVAQVQQVDLNVIKDQFGNFTSGLSSTSPTEQNFPVNVPRQLEIGGHHVRFIKLLDEGGFSYVFLVKDINTGEEFALKRLLSQEKEGYEKNIQEIKFMKQLQPHPNIINIKGTKSFNTKNGKIIYILMELATDSLVGRLQEKFSARSKFREDELLRVFYDICAAVAHMHSQQPALIHRDLKVENVLICENRHKLCDFGSATSKVYHLESTREIQLAEEDIQLNTTLAYRPPEMADPYSGMPINEKSDVWALGCILYKLCFFVGPFEEASKLQIMNAKYTIPNEPVYSKDIIDLIKYTLVLDPRNRPDVFAVMERVCKLRGVENPLPKRPMKSSQPQKTQTRVVTSPMKKPTSNQIQKQVPEQGGLFSMLDWQDDTGKVERAQTQPQPKQQQQEEEFETDFEANFEQQDFETDFSKLEIEEKPKTVQKQFVMKQVSGEGKKDVKPTSPPPKKYNESNDLFSQLDWHDNTKQKVATPIQSQPQVQVIQRSSPVTPTQSPPHSPIPRSTGLHNRSFSTEKPPTHNRSFSTEKAPTPTKNNANLLDKLFDSPMQPQRVMPPPRTNNLAYYPMQHQYPPQMLSPQHRGHMRVKSEDYYGTTNFGLVQPTHMRPSSPMQPPSPMRQSSPMRPPMYQVRNAPPTNRSPSTPTGQKNPSPFDSLNEFSIHKS